MRIDSNIAFAGLTAAGKTTHARRLAHELGYSSVSATDVLLDILRIDEPSEQVWFGRLHEIQDARADGAVDAELEDRLVSLNQVQKRTVFDTWALAWIGHDPLVRIWIESDFESRVRKCIVSRHPDWMTEGECSDLIQEKDDFNRRMFRKRHGFDLFTARDRYHAVLCNSHLIPTPTISSALSGIEEFAPTVRAAVMCVMESDEVNARALQRSRPREVTRISIPG